jgi:tetratricopeptide (TPR) repeat protein
MNSSFHQIKTLKVNYNLCAIIIFCLCFNTSTWAQNLDTASAIGDEAATARIIDNDDENNNYYNFEVDNGKDTKEIKLAYSLWNQKKYKDALIMVNKAIALNPKSVYNNNLKSYIYAGLNNYQEAVYAIDKCIALTNRRDEDFEMKANCLSELNQIDSAVVYYEKAIKINSGNERYYSNLIYTLKLVQNWDKILNVWQDYTVRLSNDKINENKGEHQDDMNFYVGVSYQQKKDTNVAIDYYTRAIKINPNVASYYQNRGMLYSDKKQYTLAFLDYNKAIELKPKDPSAYLNRGTAYSELDQNDKALKDFLMVKSLNLDDADINNNLGNVYKNKKMYKEALLCYNRAIALEPENKLVYNNRAIVYKELGLDSLSKKDYGTSIKTANNKEISFYNMGNDLQMKGDAQAAIPYFDSAIFYKPKFIEAYNQLGLCYSNLKMDSIAISIYSKGFAFKPDYDLMYINRGNSFKSLKKYSEAEKDYKKTYTLDPSKKVVFYLLADLYNEMGENVKAKSAFEDAERANVTDVEFFIDYSSFLIDEQQAKKAIEICNKGIAAYPKNGKVLMNRAIAYEALGQTQNAVLDYNKAIALNPKSPIGYYNYGIHLLNKQKYNEAITNFDKAIAIDNKNMSFYLNKANAYYFLKNYPKAFEGYNKMIELDPTNSDAYYNRANMKMDLEDKDGAKLDYDTCFILLDKLIALNDKRDSKMTSQSLDIVLKKAGAFQSTEQFEKAANEYQKYLNFVTNDASAYDNYAYCLLEIDKIIEARDNLKSAYALDKKNPDILVGLMAVSYLLNEKKNLNIYKTALYQLQPDLPNTAKAIDVLMSKGYSYTEKFKAVFENCYK